MTAAHGMVSQGTGQARASRYRRLGWWRDTTFLDDLRRNVRDRPRKLAIAGRRIAESRTDTLDYAELNQLTDRFAGALLALGVRRGDVVAVQLPNRWEMVPLMFACMRIGAVICPISPLCPKDELRHRLELTASRVCVTPALWEDSSPAAIATALSGEIASLEHVAVVDGPVPEGAVDFHAHFVDTSRTAAQQAELDGLELEADAPFVVLFTSGTTGESKGVLHSQNTVHAALRGYVDSFGLGDDLVAAVSTPLCHYSGFAQGILAAVMLGGTVAFQDARRNEALLDLVERYGATLLYGPPATVVGVTAAQRTEPRDISTLRHVVAGSAPVLERLVDEVDETLGARTHSLWGMSEIGPATMTRPEDAEGWAARSNGRPIDSVETRIDSCGTGDSSAEVGRLRVRGASLALDYYRRSDMYAAEFDPDGWFDTGDLACDDGRGGIRVLGRARDAVVRDGLVLPMSEIEAVIASHPRIGDAALVGLPGLPHDTVCAVVVPSGDGHPSLDDVRTHVREAGHDERFLPERLEVVPSLPKTLTGKVRKAQLRQRYART
ncbi:AMP-binding protein [Streptomonospora sp. PA3]|uniref:AMP-binding protein n=1 Tax=Streptomonospora sp. PA3 TaxID=2607326 RepID=UPI0012DFD68A|nr:AMP-binding protein [Streptomonospora sp. PA3]MUL41072.1 AMP-binding protein [Streptomonospora sp. PA3]